MIFLACSAVAGIGAVYVCRARRELRTVPGQTEPRFGRWSRVAAVAALLVLPLLWLVVSAVETRRELGPPVPSGRLGVVVARFELDRDLDAHTQFREQLLLSLREDADLAKLVDVKPVDRMVEGQTEAEKFEAARRLGRQTNAAVVVFGTTTRRGVFTKIVLPERPYGFVGGEAVMLVDAVADLPSLDVRTVHVITRVIGGLGHYVRGECEGARQQFALARRDIQVVEKLVPAPTVILFEANSRLCAARGARDVHAVLEETLSLYRAAEASPDPVVKAAALNGGAVAHRRLWSYTSRVEDLQSAIEAYQRALDTLGAADDDMRPAIETNLGVALEKLAATRDPETYLARALTLYASARGRVNRGDPLYARIRNNEGVALFRLAEAGSRPIERLKASIAAYEDGLPHLAGPDRRTLRPLMLSNLGDALRELALHEHADENLRRAMEVLELSVSSVKRQEDPSVFGEVHYKLGLTLGQMAGRTGADVDMSRALISLACSVLTLDEISAGGRARLAADTLVAVRARLGERLFVELLGKAPLLDGCTVALPALDAAVKRRQSRGGA